MQNIDLLLIRGMLQMRVVEIIQNPTINAEQAAIDIINWLVQEAETRGIPVSHEVINDSIAKLTLVINMKRQSCSTHS
jgi:phage gp46-like protein